MHSLSLLNDPSFMRSVKYNLSNAHGISFGGDQLRELPDPIHHSDGIIPEPDLIPLSILNHPLGKRLEIDSAAYDPVGPSILPTKDAHPMLVLCLDSPFEILTGVQARIVLWFPVSKRKTIGGDDKVHPH